MKPPTLTRPTLVLPVLLAALVLSVLAWQLSGSPRPAEAQAAATSATPSATPTVVRQTTLTPAASAPLDKADVTCGDVGATCLYLPHVSHAPAGYPGAAVLVAYQPTTGTINLVWGASGAVGYQLYRGTGIASVNGQDTLVNATLLYSGTDTQFSETRGPGDTYYQVQAGNAWGAVVSSIVKVTVQGAGGGSSYSLIYAQLNTSAGGKVNWDIMARSGDAITNLTSGSDADQIDPAWSTDGQYIAYASNQDGHWEIYRMKANGSEQTRLTQTGNGATNVQPTWSPDGQQIAFTSDAGTFNTLDIYVIPAFPGSAIAVTDDTRLTWPNAPATLVPTPTQPTPTPSPTSTPAVTATPTAGPTSSPNDNYFRQTTSRQPTWSPDGAQIAFVSNRVGHDEVFVMLASGRDQRRVTYATSEDSGPRWSPDGTRIAFMSNRSGNWEVYTIRPDGSDERRLTVNSAVDSQPTWASTSQSLVFITTRNGRNDLYTMSADGSAVQPWIVDGREHLGPSWSP